MLEDRIYNDYVMAMKAKDKDTATFLSFVRAALKNQAMELRVKKLEDPQAMAVLKKEEKRLLESKESIVTSGRKDLMASLQRELSLLSQYLPQAMPDEELNSLINEAVAQENATTMKDMGKVMKNVLAKAGVRADSKKVSELVKGKLSSL